MKFSRKYFAATLLFCLPLVSGAEWSIGMYVGNSPLDVFPPAEISNPVLTSDDVTDVSASFVADPFMLFKDGSWHMFFEVLVDNGDIGYASSVDGLNWIYHQIVINETFHMSYPYVFEWQGEIYMVPETHEANAIRLYKATGFPTQWTFVGNMLIGAYRDPSLFRHDEKWWMFTTEGTDRDDTLQLFYADDLLGPWQAHPLSPVIINDPDIARPAGRVTLFDGRLIRYTQDTFPTYGNKVRAFEITELTTTTYTEIPVVENPILDADGLGWNADGMHHIDPHQLPDSTWLAVVDGNGDPDQLDFYGLWLSNAADRSNSRLLDGEALVQGDEICVYLLPEADVDQVAFSLDGSLQQVEGYPPYDFAGTGSDASCNLYDTLSLTPGEHTLSAEITHLDSSTTSIESHFIVADMPLSNFNLLCSADSTVNGSDPDCSGGAFNGDVWLYLWPESNVDSVDFYVDGSFHKTERLAPYELGGGSPTSFSTGPHTVRAVVNLTGGGSEEVSTTFTIGTTPSSYSLLCSSDSSVDGNDTSCDGGSFSDGLWVYLWPESNVDSVNFYVDGIFHKTERFAPYELGGGSPTSFSAGPHTVRAVVNLTGGGSEEVSATFPIGTTPGSNDAPIAQAGDLTTDEDTPANGTLTASDPDGDPLTYSIVSPPGMGIAIITDVATGDFTYTPDPDQNGPDSFTFMVNNGSTDSNIETVTITINPVNDPPFAVGGCGSTPQAQALAGTLSATDPDTPALLTYSLNADGSGGDGPIITAKGGIVTLSDRTTGEFTYQPDTTAGDKRGVDNFYYQVSDTEGGISSAIEFVVVDQTIMPLGDSITMGSDFTGGTFGPGETRVGYRKPLFDTLGLTGYTFDFVGSLSHGSALLSDSEHEGHGGWTAFDVAWGQYLDGTDGVFAWLDNNPADIILLHAGTNDLANTTEFDIADILDEIERWENSAAGNPVTVILALIIDQDPINPDVTTFNSNVLEMANGRITAGDDIIVVNQQNALFYPDDLSDAVHPNADGYSSMANVWFDALTNVNQNTNEVVLDKCP